MAHMSSELLVCGLLFAQTGRTGSSSPPAQHAVVTIPMLGCDPRAAPETPRIDSSGFGREGSYLPNQIHSVVRYHSHYKVTLKLKLF